MLLQSSFWLLKLLILILSCSLPAITSFSGLQSEEPLLHSFTPLLLCSFAPAFLYTDESAAVKGTGSGSSHLLISRRRASVMMRRSWRLQRGRRRRLTGTNRDISPEDTLN